MKWWNQCTTQISQSKNNQITHLTPPSFQKEGMRKVNPLQSQRPDKSQLQREPLSMWENQRRRNKWHANSDQGKDSWHSEIDSLTSIKMINQRKNAKKRNGTVKVNTHKRDWQTQPKTCWEAQILDASLSSTMSRENRAPLKAEAETVNCPPAQASSQPWPNSHNKKETWPTHTETWDAPDHKSSLDGNREAWRLRPTPSHHSHKNTKKKVTLGMLAPET